MVVRRPVEKHYCTIVAGVEPETAAMVVDAVEQRDAFRDAALLLVNAFDPVAKGFMAYAGISPREIEVYRAEVATEARRAIETALGAAAPRHVVAVREGHPIPVLETVLEESGADLIGLSARTRSAVSRALLGSVCAHFLRRGRTDVLIIP
nr:universal stress protein [Acuticoccus kalidii]